MKHVALKSPIVLDLSLVSCFINSRLGKVLRSFLCETDEITNDGCVML